MGKLNKKSFSEHFVYKILYTAIDAFLESGLDV